MADGKIKGKQIEDTTVSLDKLSGSGQVILASGSQIQITGTASNPDDVITLKELDDVGSPLQITDYITGATFSNISNIIFRGQTVVVPSGTATGVEAVGAGPNAVTVWIPAAVYVDYFNDGSNLISSESTTNRYVPKPNGSYNIGDWTSLESTGRNVLTESSGGDVVYTCTEFSVFDTSTTLDFNFFDGDGATLSTTSRIVATGSVSSGGLTINVTSVAIDQDRYKATVTFTADLTNVSLIPPGGRFSIELVHNNSIDGTYTFTQNDIFYDSDGISSNAIIDIAGGGTVSIQEETPILKWLSGIAYYDDASTFTFSVTNIDNLNDRSYPRGTSNNISNASTGHQLRLDPTNLAISSIYYAHGIDFIGWTNSYNAQNFTYSVLGTINQNGQYIPGFNPDNVVSSGSPGYITADLFDWNTADTETSPDFEALIDTRDDTTIYSNNPIVDEDDRIDINVMGSQSTWVGTSSLAPDALQMIFGRVIYPQDNFSGFYPSINITNSRDYSGSATSNRSFIVYTDVSTGSGTTASVNINGYRWVSFAFGKNGSYTSDFGNGIFDITGNYAESDLHHDQTSSGTGDLVLMVGLDSTGNNNIADTYLWMSNDSTVYPGRSNAVTYNLTGDQIQFSKGNLSFSIRRCWLVIGYSNSATGIDLYTNDIMFS